jgi:hypothetical protein
VETVKLDLGRPNPALFVVPATDLEMSPTEMRNAGLRWRIWRYHPELDEAGKEAMLTNAVGLQPPSPSEATYQARKVR